MNQINNDQIDLRKITNSLRRKKWLIVVCLVSFLLPVVYYNSTAPLIYKNSALVLFDSQRGPASIVNPFQIDLRQNFIMNQIATMKTTTFASKVYSSLSDQEIKSFQFPENITSSFDTASFIAGSIQSGLRISPFPRADIIEIGFEYTIPALVQKISNNAADVLVQSNLEIIRESSTNVRELVAEQLKIYKDRLSKAEVALKDYKEKSNISISPDKESQEIFSRITGAEVLYNQTKADHDAAIKRLEYIQEKLSQQREDLGLNVTEVTNPWIQKLKGNLIDLEIQYTSLKVQNYSEDHPKMKQLSNQINRTKEKLKEETLKLAQGDNLIDPLSQIQKFLEESITLDIEIQTYKARQEGLRKIIDGYNESLKSVPEKDLQLARLIRDKEVTEGIYKMLLTNHQEARIAEAQNVSHIRIIDPAKYPRGPIKPRKSFNIIVSIILGISFGIGLVLVLELLDNSVKSVEDIEKITDTGVLASVPIINQNGSLKFLNRISSHDKVTPSISAKLITELEPRSPEAEAFRSLRTNLQFSGIDRQIKSVLITSPHPGAGKSLISANLAIATAQIGMKTILIDADLRKPVQHLLFNVEKEPGLINLMVSTRKILKDVLLSSDQEKNSSRQDTINSNYFKEYLGKAVTKTVKRMKTRNLFLLSCGVIPPNPSEILASKTIHLLVRLLKKEYDIVIVDSPPILAVTDAAVLAPLVEGVLMVIRCKKDTHAEISRSIDSIKRVGGKFIGCVLNGVDLTSGYYYNYYYSEDKQNKSKRKKTTAK